LPFKCNLQRYKAGRGCEDILPGAGFEDARVRGGGPGGRVRGDRRVRRGQDEGEDVKRKKETSAGVVAESGWIVLFGDGGGEHKIQKTEGHLCIVINKIGE
jgi:hypothetical protein